MSLFPIRIFNAKRLAQELGRKEVGLRTRGYYLAASFLLFVPTSYSGLIYISNPVGSWLSIYEGILIFAIMLIGFSSAYKAAGGDANPDFVMEFTCLSVPVYFTTTIVVWLTYLGVRLGFHEMLVAFYERPDNYQFILRLYDLDADIFDLLSFLAVVSVQGITFYRITQLFYTVRAQS